MLAFVIMGQHLLHLLNTWPTQLLGYPALEGSSHSQHDLSHNAIGNPPLYVSLIEQKRIQYYILFCSPILIAAQ